MKNKHICFPIEQKRYKGIPHIGVSGCWVGKCACGKILEYENSRYFHGWIETDDKYKTRVFESHIEVIIK